MIKEETGKKSLKEIIMKTEPTFFLAECFSDKNCDCFLRSRCSLKKSLSEALQAFLDSLEQKTLNDVTPNGLRA